MKQYKLKKSPVEGYRLKKSLTGLTLVGIPHKYYNKPIKVEYKGLSTIINRDSPLMHKEMFKDKFGRGGYYTLYYYEWLPNKIQLTFFP